MYSIFKLTKSLESLRSKKYCCDTKDHKATSPAEVINMRKNSVSKYQLSRQNSFLVSVYPVAVIFDNYPTYDSRS